MKPPYGSQPYLSYSGFQCAEGCRYHYWHSYIANTPPSKPDDRLGSVYGTVVGKLFETFYKDRLWRQSGAVARVALEAQVPALVKATLKEEQLPKKGRPGGIIVWREEFYAKEEDLVSDVMAAIPRGISTIRTHRLLGIDVQAELKLDSTIEGKRVGGRADFVMTRTQPHQDLVILDGKGSRKRGKYTDKLQLVWYSLLYREKFGRLPDKVAFVFWHFDPPSNIDWCTFTEAEVDELKAKILKVMQDIEIQTKVVGAPKGKPLPLVQSAFAPSAHIENCRFCPYATNDICPKGFAVVARAQEQAEARKAKEHANRWQA